MLHPAWFFVEVSRSAHTTPSRHFLPTIVARSVTHASQRSRAAALQTQVPRVLARRRERLFTTLSLPLATDRNVQIKGKRTSCTAGTSSAWVSLSRKYDPQRMAAGCCAAAPGPRRSGQCAYRRSRERVACMVTKAPCGFVSPQTADVQRRTVVRHSTSHVGVFRSSCTTALQDACPSIWVDVVRQRSERPSSERKKVELSNRREHGL